MSLLINTESILVGELYKLHVHVVVMVSWAAAKF